MNIVVTVAFVIPACIAMLLISLLIRERYNLFPGKRDNMAETNKENMENENDRNRQRYYERLISRNKKHPDDFIDLTGGAMGI